MAVSISRAASPSALSSDGTSSLRRKKAGSFRKVFGACEEDRTGITPASSDGCLSPSELDF